ncbi:MAG TPA: translation elongation factor Ts [Leptospiraceae bacterium]|nr:translation elongation factor Ts [Leptospiraceae bacterium]HMY67794.1 translation elongation factor Ts [Leptospiraceae bacterium]HMZ59492.1 translation elongation factor Ts [Leptospiraceae bacterium]HNF13803.1 translation elongation factor Ts [Leptospiraceae bacterium]HNI94480.1 translation elongation factor Ts [Leptospiraceae bacterium]
MEISSELIKDLRERTGAGLLDCKKALIENGGNMDKAMDFLREKGLAKAAKRGDRETKEGRVFSYIHANGKIGVLLELNCETDFVGNNEGFTDLGKELCLQIAASSPTYISRESVPAEIIEKESTILKTQLTEQGKKPEQIEKIIPGKLETFYSDVCLVDQIFIKENKKTVKELIQESIAKFGENITVGKFTRFQIGG